MMLSAAVSFAFFLQVMFMFPTAAFSPQDYANARNVRLELGHEAAVPLYQQLLKENPNDMTAATRIASSVSAPSRHDASCRPLDPTKMHKLRKLLKESNYDNGHVQKMFGITANHKLAFAAGPVFLTPAAAGSVVEPVTISQDNSSSLQCLVTLFLLGISVHCSVLDDCLIGGHDSVELLQDLGLVFPCQVDSTVLVPYIHLFPLEVDSRGSLIWLATDLHPRVLSTTTVGTEQDGTVMYIGPDSLALVRNLPLDSCSTNRTHAQILDLCTGSGVQALAALRRLDDSSANAVCVDINERALRFVKFNAALNGLEDQVETVQADLIAGTMTSDSEGGMSLADGLGEASDSDSQTFDLILANPPFIPVPPDNDTILQRYGLFSSGGTDGEDVLKAIVRLASELLNPDGGLLAVVSEFMNPPIPQGNQSLMKRLQEWWSNGPGGRGVLFTNEFPVDSETYSARRADTPDELEIWSRHLSQLNVDKVSPGLLFMTTDQSIPEMELHHLLVPKTDTGSIWTPSNRKAVGFMRKVVQTVLFYSGALL